MTKTDHELLEEGQIEPWYRLVINKGFYKSGPPRTEEYLRKREVPYGAVLQERQNLDLPEEERKDLTTIAEKFDHFPSHDGQIFYKYLEVLVNPMQNIYLKPFFEPKSAKKPMKNESRIWRDLFFSPGGLGQLYYEPGLNGVERALILVYYENPHLERTAEIKSEGSKIFCDFGDYSGYATIHKGDSPEDFKLLSETDDRHRTGGASPFPIAIVQQDGDSLVLKERARYALENYFCSKEGTIDKKISEAVKTFMMEHSKWIIERGGAEKSIRWQDYHFSGCDFPLEFYRQIEEAEEIYNKKIDEWLDNMYED